MNKNFLELIAEYIDSRNQMDHFLEGIEMINTKLNNFNSYNLDEQKQLLNELKNISIILNKVPIGNENRYLNSKKNQINNLINDLELSLNTN